MAPNNGGFKTNIDIVINIQLVSGRFYELRADADWLADEWSEAIAEYKKNGRSPAPFARMFTETVLNDL